MSQTECEQPLNAKVKILKRNKEFSNTEVWRIYDENNVLIQEQNGGSSDNIDETFEICHAAGNWKIVLIDETDGGWTAGSLLIISLYKPTDGYETISIATLWTGYTVTYYVNTKYLIYPGSSLKLFRNVETLGAPANWYGVSFTDGSWEDFSTGVPNVSGQHIYLFRTTFTINSLANYHGLDISVKCRQAYLLYLNGVEVYRYHLPGGEISSTTDSLSQDLNFIYRQITYKLSSVHTGTNYFAIAVVRYSGHTFGTVDMRFTLRLMSESAQFGHSYGLANYGSSGGSTNGLYDFRMDTNWRTAMPAGSSAWINVGYANGRAGYINKYCITNANQEPGMDPAAWTISASDDGSAYTQLSSESGITWQTRNERQCFFIPQQSKPWNQFKMEFSATSDPTHGYIGFAEWEIMVEDLDSLNPPAFSLTPNDITAYVGENVPQMSESSEIYAKYRISPPLPYPLEMDTNNGRIHGIAAAPMPRTTYTVTAANHLGVDCFTTFSLTILDCTTPNSIMTIVMTTNESGDMEWALHAHGSSEVIDSRTDLAKYATLRYPLCKPNGLYDLVLTSKVPTGWGTGKFEIYDSANKLITSGTVSVNESPKTVTFNSGYLVSPVNAEWKYLDGSSPVSTWKSLTFNDASWSTAVTGAIPVPTSITQYYRATFNYSGSTDGYSGIELTVDVTAGVIVYLNGQEILRSYMPEGEVSSDTIAIGERTRITTLNHALALAFNPINSGVNVFAIEVHHYTTIPTSNSFKASLRFLADKSYRVYNGVASGIPEQSGNEGNDKVWDNNVLTKTCKPGCNGVTFQYTFEDNRQELISAYEVFSANDCNQRHPSGWRLEASNDGETWTVLHKARNQIFSGYRQGKAFTFYNDKTYNSYRLYVTECNNSALDVNDACGTGSTQLSEIRLFLSNTVISCPAQDGYSPAIEGTDAYKACPAYYGGSYSKQCINGVLSATEENDCVVQAPISVDYGNAAFIFYQGTDTNLVPVVKAANYTCGISPSLFDGLSIVPSTGAIVGKATNIEATKTFTVTCSNNVGTPVYTVVSLSVQQAPSAPVWVYIILVIAIIIIVAIVAFCLYARLKGSGKKKTHVSLDKKKAAATKPDDKKNKTVRI